MLLDVNSPRSKAILAAAQELDALQRLWQRGEFQAPEVDAHIGKLRSISAAEFQDSQFIRKWLDEPKLAFQDGYEPLYRVATPNQPVERL
jgi:hypothetical protein